MNLLLIETATERGMCSYFSNHQEIFTCHLPFGLQQGQQLLGELDQLLKTHSISLDSLNAIAVGVGPGSYTGIRIAATIGKMIAFARKIPIIGVCTLEAFEPETDGKFAVILDAKIGGVYLQIGEKSNGNVHFVTPPKIVPLEEAMVELKDVPLLVCPNPDNLKLKLKGEWKWVELPPSPKQMAKLAQKQLGKPQQPLELLYLRKTQAEIEQEKKE